MSFFMRDRDGRRAKYLHICSKHATQGEEHALVGIKQEQAVGYTSQTTNLQQDLRTNCSMRQWLQHLKPKKS